MVLYYGDQWLSHSFRVHQIRFRPGSVPDHLTRLMGNPLLRGREGMREEDGRDMNASISLSIKLNIRLMLVGLPSWRKTDPTSISLMRSSHLSFALLVML